MIAYRFFSVCFGLSLGKHRFAIPNTNEYLQFFFWWFTEWGPSIEVVKRFYYLIWQSREWAKLFTLHCWVKREKEWMKCSCFLLLRLQTTSLTNVNGFFRLLVWNGKRILFGRGSTRLSLQRRTTTTTSLIAQMHSTSDHSHAVPQKLHCCD